MDRQNMSLCKSFIVRRLVRCRSADMLWSLHKADQQREMDNLRSERDKTLVALRDLEMGNDELERNER